MIGIAAIAATICKFVLSRMRFYERHAEARHFDVPIANAGCRSIVITGAFSGNGLYIRVRDTGGSFLRIEREREREGKREESARRVI